ncbi:MAG TPA: class I SAM-dependent RNA methyltransferase [Cyclobacteriaceae bacterium]|nr:class I SAM-dependent RNA methyltransferase [Cyclobacteriaceae bacterium]HRJ81477.1 class I SAM-dependent RNA methyltransferase [Cyclobacteriaceae bacterium]
MLSFTRSSRIIVTCNKRLAPYLRQEIEELSFFPERTFQTGVELQGTINDCIKLNLNLRCASQVLFSLKEFKASDADKLYANLVNYPWDNILDKDGYFTVTSNVNNPTINNELFVNVKVKDAIVDRMRKQTGKRPDSGPDLDKTVIHLYWKDNDAEIFLDTSGQTLSKHGYRKIPGRAPMLEALACASVMATTWDKTSPFINPMCGSGTVAIEAALLATNRRPGLFRKNYSFMHVLGYDNAAYQNEHKKLLHKIKEVPGLLIHATDNREDAINISRINAQVAGVEELINFSVCDFEKTPIPEGSGVVFLNPEYGERMGELAELELTYKRIGDFMKKQCQGYRGYIFTGNLDLAKKIGLKAKRRIEFYSAKLDCRLLEYELYAGSKEK